jgi:hypothetical protein
MTAAAARITEMMKPEQRIPQLGTLQELAKLWAVPVSWLCHHTRASASDPLPIVRLGRYVRVDLNDPELLRWLNRRRTGR